MLFFTNIEGKSSCGRKWAVIMAHLTFMDVSYKIGDRITDDQWPELDFMEKSYG